MSVQTIQFPGKSAAAAQEALAARFRAVTEARPGAWHVASAAEAWSSGVARLERDWLTVTLEGADDRDAAARPDGPDGLSLVMANGLLPPCVKVVRPDAGARINLVGEARGDNVASMLDDLLAVTDAPLPAIAESSRGESEAVDLDPIPLLDEGGWAWTQRRGADGAAALSVRLESGRHGQGINQAPLPCDAFVDAHRGGVRSWIELYAEDVRAADDATTTAAAELLLRAAGAVRLARAAAHRDADRQSLRLEVLLPASTTSADLNEALGSLSVAYQLCGPETTLLCTNAAVARRFLDTSLRKSRNPD